MSLFIRVELDRSACVGLKRCGGCVRVCPVGIFERTKAIPAIREANEDECTLCDLCLQACLPGAIRVVKLYE